MDWQNLLYEIFEICLIPLLGIITTYIVKFVNAKTDEIAKDNDNELLNKYLYMLDKTITQLSVKLPAAIVYACCSIYEDNIYIFGGLGGISNGIYKFNCTTETISKLTTTLPQSLYSSCCARYENNIFIHKSSRAKS